MEKKAILFGLGAAFLLAIVVSPFASPWPDGLEKVAEEKGFLERGEGEPLLRSPVPDYEMPAVRGGLSTSAAGALGTLVVFLATCGLAALLRKKEA
jgi:cobalt/nickel transport protein